MKFSVLLFTLCLWAYGNNLPEGFTEEILESVKKGNVVIQTEIETELEIKDIARAYLKEVTPESYIRLAVNHKQYINMFEEVEQAETLSAQNPYKYRFDLIIKIGFLTSHLYPEGTQWVTWPSEEEATGKIVNTLTNYKEDIESLVLYTELIPYEEGILVQETVHLKMKPSSFAGQIRDYLRKYFAKFIPAFRKELTR